MSSNPKIFSLLGILFLVPMFAAELMAPDSPISSGNMLNKPSSDWGVTPGDVLSFTVQLRLDGKDVLPDAVYPGPLVTKYMVESLLPYVPPYAASQENLTFVPSAPMTSLGYFHGNKRSSQDDLSTAFPEFGATATHDSFLANFGLVHPSYWDYYAKQNRTGTVTRTVDPDTGDITESKIEYTSTYFRLTFIQEWPDFQVFSELIAEFSRHDAILRKLQIVGRRPYFPNELAGTGLTPGLHRTEEQIEFLKKERGGYIHGGSSDLESLFLLALLGLAFGLGTIAGIRMRQLRARKNS